MFLVIDDSNHLTNWIEWSIITNILIIDYSNKTIIIMKFTLFTSVKDSSKESPLKGY